jgi:hypothetical protein
MSRSSGWGAFADRRLFHGSNMALIDDKHINYTGADDQFAMVQIPTPLPR